MNEASPFHTSEIKSLASLRLFALEENLHDPISLTCKLLHIAPDPNTLAVVCSILMLGVLELCANLFNNSHIGSFECKRV